MIKPPSERFTDEGRRRLIGAIEEDVERDLYDGVVIKIAHRGEVVVDEAVGWADRAGGRKQRTDDIFKLMSITKAFTNLLVYRAIDHGWLALNTPVVEVIPEFWGPDAEFGVGRGKLTVFHLLTHTSGLPTVSFPLPIQDAWDLSRSVEAICNMQMQIVEPGTRLAYSATMGHSLLGEMVARTDPTGRCFNQIVREEIFEPLEMKDSFMGPVAEDVKDRLVPFTSAAGEDGAWNDDLIVALGEVVDHEGSEIPAAGAQATATDVLTFAEMMRNWGSANGRDFVSPAILDRATKVHTGDMLDDFFMSLPGTEDIEPPNANFGFGFGVGGEGNFKLNMLGTLRSPRAFGWIGLGTTQFWTDMERELSYVMLSTRAMEESKNYFRYQRLSDLAISALR